MQIKFSTHIYLLYKLDAKSKLNIKMIKQVYRKTRRGKFQKIVKEVYLSKEIPCGLASCQTCESGGGKSIKD